ncbi:MAG TPA: alpha/beta fold hydrolase [Myxococcota bacterium]|nr:alpha/beta fold hydrolase [Myxococcota bacterium]
MSGPRPDEFRHLRIAANGLRFHVAEAGAGDRLALCLHGFPECWYSWRHQMPLLAKLGHRVWAPDLRGYGESDRPSSIADYAIETLMDDVGGLIDASGAREVTLLCHDWGGIIGWCFAMRKVRPLARLVCMNIPHLGAGLEASRLRQRLRSWYILFFQLPWLPEKLLVGGGARRIGRMFRDSAKRPEAFDDADVEVYRENALRPGAATAMIHYYRALLRGGGFRRQIAQGFPTIETPTLLLWGTEDVALGTELVAPTGRFVRDLTVRFLPGIGHWVQQEAPETVNAMLEAWLLGRPVPGGDSL